MPDIRRLVGRLPIDPYLLMLLATVGVAFVAPARGPALPVTEVGVYGAVAMLESLSNPALAEAQARTPVTVVADPATCSLQFDITGKASFSSACDIAKSALANAGVSYANRAGPAGSAPSTSTPRPIGAAS